MENKRRSGAGGIIKRVWNFSMLERQLSRLSPESYIRWITLAYRFGCLRNPHPGVRFSCGPEGIWRVEDKGEKLMIPSHRRAPRYLHSGIQGILERLIKRYFPDPSHLFRLKDATIFDVGANIGEFSMACMSKGAKHVIAVEPDEIPFQCLRGNLGERLPQASVEQCVLSDKPGTVTFYVSTETADSSFITPEHYTEAIKMRAVTLDEIVQKYNVEVDVLKVEAEGAEPEVLEGALQTLRTQSPYLTVRASYERNGKSTFKDCERILREAGYECVDGGDGMQLIAWKS
jgi:FkbM family methyltransferase